MKSKNGVCLYQLENYEKCIRLSENAKLTYEFQKLQL